MKNCKQTAEKCEQILKIGKNLRPIKCILALPTWGQKCVVSAPQPIKFVMFRTEHPIVEKEAPNRFIYTASWQVTLL